jgi:hypothetical protein
MKKIILLSLIIVSHAASAATLGDRFVVNIKIREAQRLARTIKNTKTRREMTRVLQQAYRYLNDGKIKVVFDDANVPQL